LPLPSGSRRPPTSSKPCAQVEQLDRHVDAARQPARQVLFLRLDLDRVARLGHVDACAPPRRAAPSPAGMAVAAASSGGDARLPLPHPAPPSTPPSSSRPAAEAASAQRVGTTGRRSTTRAGAGTGSSSTARQRAQRLGVGGPQAHAGGVFGVVAQPGLDGSRARLRPASSPSSQATAARRWAGGGGLGVHVRPPGAAPAGAAAALPVEVLPQRRAGAAHARHHGADGDVHHLGHLGIAELLDADQQQRLALLGAEPAQRGQQVQPQADVGAGVAAARSCVRCSSSGSATRSARVAPAAVQEGVVRDRQHPDQHVAPLVELVPVRQRALQRVLRQVVGRGGVEHQRARIAPQPRQGVQQLGAVPVSSIVALAGA
jgi:hypothetical protein